MTRHTQKTILEFVSEKNSISNLNEQKKLADMFFYDEFSKVSNIIIINNQKHIINDLNHEIKKLKMNLNTNQQNIELKSTVPLIPTISMVMST